MIFRPTAEAENWLAVFGLPLFWTDGMSMMFPSEIYNLCKVYGNTLEKFKQMRKTQCWLLLDNLNKAVFFPKSTFKVCPLDK